MNDKPIRLTAIKNIQRQKTTISKSLANKASNPKKPIPPRPPSIASKKYISISYTLGSFRPRHMQVAGLLSFIRYRRLRFTIFTPFAMIRLWIIQ